MAETITNLRELVAVCTVCDARHDPESVVDATTSWPTCCDEPLLLVNLTDRDGEPVDRGDGA